MASVVNVEKSIFRKRVGAFVCGLALFAAGLGAMLVIYQKSKGDGMATTLSTDKWYQCSTDDECIVAQGVCGHPVAINKKYLEAFNRKVQVDAMSVDCSYPTPDAIAYRKRVIARCVGGRCTLVDPLKKE